jgi:hypothetical protein
MKWITERPPHVDRCALAWFIRRFVDPRAEILFVGPGEAAPRGAIPFDLPSAELGHRGGKVTFDALLAKYPTRYPRKDRAFPAWRISSGTWTSRSFDSPNREESRSCSTRLGWPSRTIGRFFSRPSRCSRGSTSTTSEPWAVDSVSVSAGPLDPYRLPASSRTESVPGLRLATSPPNRSLPPSSGALRPTGLSAEPSPGRRHCPRHRELGRSRLGVPRRRTGGCRGFRRPDPVQEAATPGVRKPNERSGGQHWSE